MKYSIIIPTYNHCRDFLQPCIESILRYTNMGSVELVISANGCTDESGPYLSDLHHQFGRLGFAANLKVVWHDQPLGYSRAVNAALDAATADHIVLLNNDTQLLNQPIDFWLHALSLPFKSNPRCGISCVVKSFSEPANHEFAIFFCVMISKHCFDVVGKLSEEYLEGAGEDTEFCIEATRAGFEIVQCLEVMPAENQEFYTGNFPIYHRGEGTLHDTSLVPDFQNTFAKNTLRLAKKYNPGYMKNMLATLKNRTRLYFKGDEIDELTRGFYQLAGSMCMGPRVLELGCNTGFGSEFFPYSFYTGCDIDNDLVECAKEQKWRDKASFVCNSYTNIDFSQYDTVIIFDAYSLEVDPIPLLTQMQTVCKQIICSFQLDAHKAQIMTNKDYFTSWRKIYLNTAGHMVSPLATSEHALLVFEWMKK